jgi:8-oxo-dGTP pyrophosphatase MutT (NUDIX family)
VDAVLAAGAVLWRFSAPPDSRVEVALVHRPRYDDWSLPKGKLEPEESTQLAAVREVAEETGFWAVLGRQVGQTRYRVTRPAPAPKTVDYFAARARLGRFTPNREVDELRWVAPEAAEELLTYPHDRDILAAFRALPADLATMALVRHADAGSRKEWSAADELRPLSRSGWRQAAGLRELLPLFGIDRVHSAPLVRCEQTVAAVARDLGVPVELEPLLSEEGYAVDPRAGADRLLSIVAAGGTPVVSSQGGVIPDVLSRLAKDAGVTLDNPKSQKGSAWILSFTRDPAPTLVAADYIPPS